MAVADGSAAGVAELAALARLLMYGDPRSRREAAGRLRFPDGTEPLAVLAATARRDTSWRLRVRALEALATVAAAADRPGAERILALLFDPAVPARW